MAIAIYARQSVEKENSISCDTQIEHCKAKLNPNERTEKIIVFKDEGFTGANTNREGFQKMIRMVEQNKISKILVYKLDRISRSIVDYSNMMKTFKEHSVSQEFKEKIQNLQEKVEKHNKKVYNYALKVMLQKKGITKVRQEITLSQWWYVSEEKFGVDNDEKAIIYADDARPYGSIRTEVWPC